jgi:hypothetical protein
VTNKLNLSYAKISEDTIDPQYAYESDSGIDLYSNEELFKAYPKLKNTEVIFYDTNNKLYDNNLLFVFEDKIYINKKDYERNLARGIQNDNNGTTLGQAIAHELAHIIQTNEGFAQGSSRQFNEERIRESISFFRNRTDRFSEREGTNGRYDRYVERTLRDTVGNEIADDVLNTNNIPLELIVNSMANKLYKNFAGEVEARNVEKRFFMSPQERLNNLLAKTQSIPFEDQFVLQFKNSLPQTKAIEPNLEFETPKGETFNNYEDALKNTDEGKIALKIEGETIAEVDSDTNIETFEGAINKLVKAGGLTGERVLDSNGDEVFIVKGATNTMKQFTSEMVNGMAVKLFGASNVKQLSTGDFIFTKPKKDETIGKDFNQLEKELGVDQALSIEVGREISKVLKYLRLNASTAPICGRVGICLKNCASNSSPAV